MCNALNPFQCPVTAFNGHKKIIPKPFPFIIRVAPFFSSVFYLLPPKLYKMKYKPKLSMDMKNQTRRVLKQEDK